MKYLPALGAVVLALALFAPVADPLRVLGLAIGALLCWPMFLAFETTVADGAMHLRVRPLWRKTIALGDVESVELTVADGQVEVFGGWNPREFRWSALDEARDGHRTINNRAVVLHLRSRARPQQVGTFRPQELLAAIEAQRSSKP